MTIFLVCLAVFCAIAFFGLLNMPEEAMLFRRKCNAPDPELQKIAELQALAEELSQQAEQLQQENARWMARS